MKLLNKEDFDRQTSRNADNVGHYHLKQIPFFSSSFRDWQTRDWQGLIAVGLLWVPVTTSIGEGRMCFDRLPFGLHGAVYFGNASEIWSFSLTFMLWAQLKGSCFWASPSLLLSSAQAALPPEELKRGFGGVKEGRRSEGKKLIILHRQSIGDVKERVISAGLPLSASCFSAPFMQTSTPTPRPHPAILWPPSCALSFSFSLFFLPPPLHTFLSFVFISPPAVFLDRSLTHAFPFRISIGLFCALSLCALVPFSFCVSCPRVKQPPPRWVRMTVPLAFPVPALPTSVQLLSQGRGGFGMVGWQRQGDWCKNEVQKKGERVLGGGREMV